MISRGDEGVVLSLFGVLGGRLLTDRAVLLLEALHEGANLIVVFCALALKLQISTLTHGGCCGWDNGLSAGLCTSLGV
jgi:hypothetical protein